MIQVQAKVVMYQIILNININDRFIIGGTRLIKFNR